MRIESVSKNVTIDQQMLDFVHQPGEPNHVVPSRVVGVQYVVDERGPNDGLSDDRYDVRRDVVDSGRLHS